MQKKKIIKLLTGYSYFYEAFETFNALSRDPKDTSSKKDPDAKAKAKAIYSLKYMLLCKIMVSQADDVAGIISSYGLEYLRPEHDAMKAVAMLTPGDLWNSLRFLFA
ncbi:26S proteasome non-ATPase regulatory subunit 11 -like protein [Capsicum baccatum]|uniref:26S proteasome non-ATPase regulatory subunit 11-like protein n=1 Tax=Capsicum baccatum TaxID=33114 RepID=A0A2G2WD45_CAPBA|nr:26S proteasome non-ATPase regulatory subunit 11 -like protein [Capsicum baccatum]